MAMLSDDDLISYLNCAQELLTRFGVRSEENKGIFPYQALLLSAVENATTRDEIARILAERIYVPERYEQDLVTATAHRRLILSSLQRRLGHSFKITDEADVLTRIIEAIQRT